MPTTLIDKSLDEVAGDSHAPVPEPEALFREARQRRRKRMLLAGAIASLSIALVLTFLAAGGAGHFFGGPNSRSGSHQPSSAQTGNHSSSPSHGQANTPSSTGTTFCNETDDTLPPNAKANATLLPCYGSKTAPPAVSK
jgi:hypothetical protein